ncbi:MAG: hypothetical protein LBE97_02640 [Holosporales bacterium]|jgi:hypothetical protein|nr:hypothetical protein [Holosporales bacterium]
MKTIVLVELTITSILAAQSHAATRSPLLEQNYTAGFAPTFQITVSIFPGEQYLISQLLDQHRNTQLIVDNHGKVIIDTDVPHWVTLHRGENPPGQYIRRFNRLGARNMLPALPEGLNVEEDVSIDLEGHEPLELRDPVIPPGIREVKLRGSVLERPIITSPESPEIIRLTDDIDVAASLEDVTHGTTIIGTGSQPSTARAILSGAALPQNDIVVEAGSTLEIYGTQTVAPGKSITVHGQLCIPEGHTLIVPPDSQIVLSPQEMVPHPPAPPVTWPPDPLICIAMPGLKTRVYLIKYRFNRDSRVFILDQYRLKFSKPRARNERRVECNRRFTREEMATCCCCHKRRNPWEASRVATHRPSPDQNLTLPNGATTTISQVVSTPNGVSLNWQHHSFGRLLTDLRIIFPHQPRCFMQSFDRVGWTPSGHDLYFRFSNNEHTEAQINHAARTYWQLNDISVTEIPPPTI